MSKRIQRAVIVFLLVFCLIQVSVARVVDISSKPDRLLDSLVANLDRGGIDIRRGPGNIRKPFIPLRPQLTRLENFPFTDSSKIRNSGRFTTHFEAGVFTESYLVAVDIGRPYPDISEDEFEKVWGDAPKDKRIFVSFSRKDIEYAERVRAALEAEDYVTFLYLNGSSKYPQTNAVQVGTYFKKAGNHLVIDTQNARSSMGVIAEAQALRAMRSGKRKIFGTPEKKIDTPPPSGSAKVPCCKLCWYKNGIRTRCNPVECGPQCRRARPSF